MTSAASHMNTQESTCTAGGFPLLWSAFSLVPLALIEDETPDLWLNFLRERVPHDQAISSVTLEEDRLVCLYESKTQADGAAQEHVIPYILTRACEIEDADCALAIREGERLAIVCYKDAQLQLGNIFEASTKEQALYWILKTYEELGLTPTTPLYVRCGEGTRKLLSAHLNTRPLEG